MIKADGLRLLPTESTGIHDSIAALVLLSAAGHLGAVLWALSGPPSDELSTEAGSAAVMEVTLVAGPAHGSPDDSARSAPAAARPIPVPEPVPAERADPATVPDRVASADRAPPPPIPVQRTQTMVSSRAALPPATNAPPVPPPKPDLPTENQTTASLPAAPTQEETGLSGMPQPPAQDVSAPDPGNGTAGGTRGAAPRADNPAPSYPASARRRGQEGRVILKVEVLPGGEAGTVVLEKSSGVASLDRAALDTVRRWRFRPARRNGHPVAATVQVPIRFALQ